jgi:hypothetical protein
MFQSLNPFSSRKTLDPLTLSPEKVSAIHRPAEAVSLLRQAIDSKQENYIAIALNVVYRISSEDDKHRNLTKQLADCGVCGLVDGLMGQSLTNTVLCKSCLQVMYALMGNSVGVALGSLAPVNRLEAAAKHMLTSSLSILHAMPSTTSSSSSGQSGTAVSATIVAKFATSGTLFRIIKAGQCHMQDLTILVYVLRCLLIFSHDSGKS